MLCFMWMGAVWVMCNKFLCFAWEFASVYMCVVFVCVVVTIDSSVRQGNVCSTWSPRQISLWGRYRISYHIVLFHIVSSRIVLYRLILYRQLWCEPVLDFSQVRGAVEKILINSVSAYANVFTHVQTCLVHTVRLWSAAYTLSYHILLLLFCDYTLLLVAEGDKTLRSIKTTINARFDCL